MCLVFGHLHEAVYSVYFFCSNCKLYEDICPFTSFMTPFGEAIEFNYMKATRLVIDAFGLLDIGREWAINLSASIDAAA